MDGKYIESVHKRYGTRPMKTFPNLTIGRFLRWASIRNIRRVRPLYWMDYNKEEAKTFLARELGWEWYGGHHLENRFTAFYHSYFLYNRWGIDGRLLGYSALIRSGQMDREEGLRLVAEPPHVDPEIIALVKKRLGFSDAEFDAVMTDHVTTTPSSRHTSGRSSGCDRCSVAPLQGRTACPRASTSSSRGRTRAARRESQVHASAITTTPSIHRAD